MSPQMATLLYLKVYCKYNFGIPGRLYSLVPKNTLVERNYSNRLEPQQTVFEKHKQEQIENGPFPQP